MENSELIESHEIIDDSCSPDQQDTFRDAIEKLEAEDLENINDYLNLGCRPNQTGKTIGTPLRATNGTRLPTPITT